MTGWKTWHTLQYFTCTKWKVEGRGKVFRKLWKPFGTKNNKNEISAVIKRFAQTAPEDVVVELVVAGHGDETALASAEGEKDLHRSVTPYLHNHVTQPLTSRFYRHDTTEIAYIFNTGFDIDTYVTVIVTTWY